MAIQLTDEQKAAVNNRDGQLLVSAAAGSGKTRVLVDRLMKRVAEEKANLDSFLIITYTRAAAAELRGKILDEVNRRLAEHPDDRHLQKQTTLVYRAQISTIHSFCQNVLKENGHLIELDPDFRVGDDADCAILQRGVLEELLEQHYETVRNGDSFSLLVDTMADGKNDYKLISMVLDIYTRVQSHDDPIGWLREQQRLFALEGIGDLGETEWGRLLLRESRETVLYWAERLREAVAMMEGWDKLEDAYRDAFLETIDSLEDFAEATEQGWDTAAAVGFTHGTLGRYGSKNDGQEVKARVYAVWKDCMDTMKKVMLRFARGSAELLDELRYAAPAVIALLELVVEFDAAYGAEKRRRKLVDFADLEHLALKVLRKEDGTPSDTARRLSERFTEVMVDEYQDTNRCQNAIFDAVSDGGRKLFQVGDVKQSIYRFRLADPTIFMRKYREFKYAEFAETGEPRKLVLSANFRSRREVLDAANFVFEGLMHEEFAEIEYNEDHRLNFGATYYPDYDGAACELNVISTDELKEQAKQNDEKAPAGIEAEADFIAGRIERLLREGYMVRNGDDTMRPVRYEDIVILYRSPGSVMGTLSRALDAHNIPWQAETGEDFFRRIEVMTALSFLQVVDNPHQDVPLVSVLRSPVYGFTANRLAQLRGTDKKADLYTCVCKAAEQGEADCADFLRELRELRALSTDRTAAELLWEIYERTALPALYQAMPGGELRKENLLLLYEYARGTEGKGHPGVFGLVTQLRRQEETGKKFKLGGVRGGGVRVMSIHKSKGLEFPVVILGGLCRDINKQDARESMLFHPTLGLGPKGLELERGIRFDTVARTAVALKLNRETNAEELRLLYVAMTRPQEKLILVCTPGGQGTCESKLQKLCGVADWPMSAQALNDLQTVGDWLLAAALTRTECAVLRCGELPARSEFYGDHPWEVHLVSPSLPEKTFTQKRTEEAATRRSVGEQAKLLRWRYPHAELAELPSKVTATQLKGRFRDQEAAEETAKQSAEPVVEQPGIPFRVPEFREPDFSGREKPLTAAQKGTVLHLLLQLSDPEKACTVQGAAEELERLRRSRILTDRQADSCDSARAAAFFSSELGREARRAGLRREFKFSLLDDAANYYSGDGLEGEQVLLQGVADLWFETDEGLTIVDFKTDRVTPGKEALKAEEYRQQLDIYGAALARITGKRIARRILWFLRTNTPVTL